MIATSLLLTQQEFTVLAALQLNSVVQTLPAANVVLWQKGFFDFVHLVVKEDVE